MKQCLTCQNNFIITRDRAIFCSHTCQAKWAIKKASIAKKPKRKTGKLFNCVKCEKEFYAPLYRIKTGKVKYCSRSCLAKDLLKKYVAINGFKTTGKPHHKYKYIKIDGKRIREHRYIMQEHLGRKLERWEHVHHINDDPSDNRIENLQVLSNSDHQKAEYKFRKSLISSS